MRIDFTPIFRPRFVKIARRVKDWPGNLQKIQTDILSNLIKKGRITSYGKRYDFNKILGSEDI